jgi:hypothetical protein
MVALLVGDGWLGVTLWLHHGAGPVVVSLVTAVLFAGFLSSRRSAR